MSFIFTQQEPTRFGITDVPDVSLGEFLGAAGRQGFHDSILSSIYRMSELNAAKREDPILNPRIPKDQANAEARELGIPIEFDDDPTQDEFNLIATRKQRELERATFLRSAKGKAGRTVLGFGTSMLASVANPVDLATMFIPLVGTTSRAAPVARGVGALSRARNVLATVATKGLLTTEEALATRGVFAPKIVGSMIEGAAGQFIAEIPLAISNVQDQTTYTSQDFFTNIIAGGVLGGSFRVALMGVAKVMQRVSARTKRAADLKAMEDFLRGDDVNVSRIFELDEEFMEMKLREAVEEELRGLERTQATKRAKAREVSEETGEPLRDPNEILEELSAAETSLEKLRRDLDEIEARGREIFEPESEPALERVGELEVVEVEPAPGARARAATERAARERAELETAIAEREGQLADLRREATEQVPLHARIEELAALEARRDEVARLRGKLIGQGPKSKVSHLVEDPEALRVEVEELDGRIVELEAEIEARLQEGEVPDAARSEMQEAQVSKVVDDELEAEPRRKAEELRRAQEQGRIVDETEIAENTLSNAPNEKLVTRLDEEIEELVDDLAGDDAAMRKMFEKQLAEMDEDVSPIERAFKCVRKNG